MTPTNLVLFGDQTVEKLSSIQSLVRHSKTSPAARRLLQEATDLVQINFARLSKEDRRWSHEIHTLLGLAEENIDEQNPNGVIATILMCIGRLGELFVYAEQDPSILGSQDDPVQVLAFCTGLLPASALVAARDTTELFDIGMEIINITFRMAYEIDRRAHLIEETNRSWATTVVGKTPENVQPILDQFHKAHEIPYPKRVAIGVASNGWITLMGAPSSLARLMEFSKELNDAPKMKTDTNGPVHTWFMPTFNIEKVLGTSPLLDTPITSKSRIISPGSCKQYNHSTLRSLLAEILVDIAHNILRINDTAEACISGLDSKRPVSLIVAGPTGHLTAVQRILQSKGLDHQLRQHRSPDTDVTRRGGSDLVAIVGMAGRFPGSDSIDGFFEDLNQGKIQIKKIPKSRFDLDTYFDPTGKRRNTTTAQHGAFMENPGYFDNRLFNVSPREAMQMDPLQRLLLTTSYEALETAGYSKDATLATQSNRIATYFGQASEDWREILNNEGIDIYYVPSLSRPFGPSRVAYHHKWGGGTYAIDSACATSTTAIQLACSALNARECDTALAGGGSLLVSPNSFIGLSKSGMISNNGGCRTYHDDADGYVRGEGIGVVVLKRLEDALAENDNIIGVIRGSARTYSSTSTSITHPSAESQARIYEEVLRQTSVVPNEIAYVEMHGTGTQAGDFEEMNSVIRVLGKGRSKANALTVGAVKANVGHGEAAAGVTSLIKVLMMMRERRIPTQPGLPFKLNHHFPKLDSLHVRIAGISGKDLTLRPSPASDNGKIKCLVNSFDASGGNTSLVIEEPPEQLKKQENPLPCHVVTISARTNASLKANRRKLADYLTRNPQTKLADLAYTTTARRMHEVLRVAYTAKSTREITNLLREDVKKEANDPKSKPPAMNMVFAFTGQGSQYAGMGKALFQHSSVYRDLLQTYQHMAEHQGLPNFLHLISDEEVDITAASAVCVQLAVVSLEIATAQLLKMWGVKPSMVMGHSLGEYSALCVAGVLSVSDTLFLVGRRAQLMEERLTTGQYAMLAIGKDLESVQQLLAADSTAKWGKTEVSCINAPQVTVVSGPLSEVQALKAKLEPEGSRATVLRVPYGFHSAHIDPILGDFEAVAKAVVFSAPTTPVASTLLGQVVDAGQPGVFSASYLMRQARRCVNFVGALQAYQECDLAKLNTFWVEIGPDPICIGLVRRTLNVPANRLLPTMKAADDSWMTLNSTLATLYQAGAPINWPQYHKEFQNSVTLIPLPTYAFDEKDFWTPYVERVDPTLAASLNAMNSEKLLQQSLKPPPPTFSTTSLQRVEDEDIQDQTISVTFASHTSEPSLYQAIQGHVVNGLTICSLSIFCDMAKSASQYAYQKLKKSTKVPNMNVFDIDMTHALVVPRLDPDQIVKTKVSYCSAGNAADITFHSIQNGITTEHGSCKIVFEESRAWFSQLSQTSFLVDARIQALKEMSGSGKAHKLLKPVIYKLFDNLVSYSKVYQGLEEVWIDLQCRDAVGTVKLPNTTGAGNFLHNPFWTDAAVHLAGFLLNGSLKYPEDIACLSTGFESWRTLEELQADEIYTTYVSMQDAETPNVLFGSAYVYNSQQKLVQATTGIKFQKMKKVVLNTVLRPNSAPIAPAIRIEKAVAWPRDLISSNKALKPSASGVNTPATQLSDYFSNHDQSGSTSTSPSSVSDNEHPSLDLYKTLLYIVASESGCGEEELQPNTSFADVGMDSLMAITILATFQRDTGVELPATFFLDHQTVDEAKEALPGKAELVSELCEKVQEEYENGTADPTAIVPTVLEAPATPEFLEPQINIKEEPKPAPLNFNSAPAIEAPISQETTKLSKVVLLNGSASSTGRKLFLFPDGSGSPSRYIQLPALGDDVNVYGLESPFLKSPTDYTCSVEAMCNSFITVLKTTQPMGPYLLGGYSLGAIYAYEIAFRLLKDGEQVDGLFVVDMGVPKALAAPITPSQDQVSAAGLLPSTGRLTNAQKDHYISTIRAMTAYRPAQCLPNQRPKKTVLLSSKSGLAAGKQSDLAQWAQGLSAASRGWEHLVGSVEVREVDAAHFELCRYPAIKKLGDAWADAFANL